MTCKSSFGPGAFAGVALLVSTLAPTMASAFCRTTTVPIPADFQPTGNRCWTEGVPLFWRNRCIGYDLQKDASRLLSLTDAQTTIAEAFSKWSGIACPTTGSGGSKVSIDIRDLGPVECGLVQYRMEAGNQNVILFQDDQWPHPETNNTLALTTVTFFPDTGEIYDADMEINTFSVKPIVGTVGPNDYDFASIVTHETGHFLGLAHSGDTQATMYAQYKPGQTSMRELRNDDIQGLCAIYRPDGKRAVGADQVLEAGPCDPTPRHGFSSTCGAVPKDGNCSSAPPSQSSLSRAPARSGLGVWLAALALGLTGARSLRRRVRR